MGMKMSNSRSNHLVGLKSNPNSPKDSNFHLDKDFDSNCSYESNAPKDIAILIPISIPVANQTSPLINSRNNNLGTRK